MLLGAPSIAARTAIFTWPRGPRQEQSGDRKQAHVGADLRQDEVALKSLSRLAGHRYAATSKASSAQNIREIKKLYLVAWLSRPIEDFEAKLMLKAVRKKGNHLARRWIAVISLSGVIKSAYLHRGRWY
jgi:hypothetical protein